ncbi:hypothetical protein RJ641_029733 [Dillenia turbinata]|uniref:Uncharacterized protein n=1 Tax=Dillenia turbinata TaxID=194707 RepID=A0AAN8ZJT0_9MAGN
MALPPEIDDYIKESIQHSLGLPVSDRTIELKLRAALEAQERLKDQYYLLQERLKEKDDIIERARAEACMNAQALKKFVEENQKLALECANLLTQCSKWEKECSLYDHDREALMEFGNEADERAKEAELRVLELEEEVKRLSEELQFYRLEHKAYEGDLGEEDMALEQKLVDSAVSTIIGKEEAASAAHSFLESNAGVDSCQRLLKMWDRLTLSTKSTLSLAAEVKMLRSDKEHLRINLHRSEEEVNKLFELNNFLDEENKRLLRQHSRERTHHGSAGKHSASATAKGNKRKSPKMSSPIDRKIDFSEVDSPRQPLSPLQQNPDFKMQKK